MDGYYVTYFATLQSLRSHWKDIILAVLWKIRKTYASVEG